MARLTVEQAYQMRISSLPKWYRGVCYYKTSRTGVVTTVILTETPRHFGGSRRWFLCPRCGRRVGILHGLINHPVACRHCLNLTYSSCQDHKRFPHDFMKRVRINQRFKEIMEGIGQKGPSKIERMQLAGLMSKVERLPKLNLPRTSSVTRRDILDQAIRSLESAEG